MRWWPLLICLLAACSKPHYVSGLEGHIDGITGTCGLYFSKENICLKTRWVTKPSESTLGEMELSFSDPDDNTRLLDPRNDVAIVLWMPSMGHGSTPVTITRTDVGRFTASEIFFIMPGPWEIRYQLKDGESIVEQSIQKITI